MKLRRNWNWQSTVAIPWQKTHMQNPTDKNSQFRQKARILLFQFYFWVKKYGVGTLCTNIWFNVPFSTNDSSPQTIGKWLTWELLAILTWELLENFEDFGTDAARRRLQHSTLLVIRTIIYNYIIYTAIWIMNTSLECIIGSERDRSRLEIILWGSCKQSLNQWFSLQLLVTFS